MNKGVIVGVVYDSDGYPSKGAFVKLVRIVIGRYPIKLRDTYANGNNNVDVSYTDSDGAFGVPFYWDGIDVAEMLSASLSGSATISAHGPTRGSCVEQVRILTYPNLERLVTMIPGGLIGGGRSKLFGKMISKRISTLKGLEGAPDLLGEAAPAKHASTENLIAVGGLEMWLNRSEPA